MSCDMNNPCAGAEGMLPQMKEKLRILNEHQKNEIQGLRPNMENRHTQQRTFRKKVHRISLGYISFDFYRKSHILGNILKIIQTMIQWNFYWYSTTKDT